MSISATIRRCCLALLLLPLLAGLVGAALPDPTEVEAAPLSVFGNRRYTVPARGTLNVTIRGYCLDKERHFPGNYLEPTDHRPGDNVLRTFAYSVARGLVRKQSYQTQLAIWYLRDNRWYNTNRPRDLAEEIVRQGLRAPMPEKPTDAPTLIEAVQSGAIKASVNDFHAITENYEGEGTLVLENTTDDPVTLYITVGTVFRGVNDTEQRMLAWPQGGIAGYTRTAAANGFMVNIRNIESRRFPQVAALVSVLDNKQMPVRDLPADRLEVFEDGKPVTTFTARPIVGGAADEPLSLLVLVEGSDESLREGGGVVQRLASDFIQGLREKDQVAVMRFGEQIGLVQNPTTDKVAAARAALTVRGEPGARFYDAIVAALEEVGKLPAGRKGIVVFSYGRDTGSDPDPDDVVAWAAEQGTPIFVVAPPDADRAALNPFAEVSGGLAFGAATPTQAAEAFEGITSYLREHYRIEFASNLRADGARHRLMVRIKGDDLQRPGEDLFLAYPNKPVVEMIAPREHSQITGTQRVEFTVRAFAPVVEAELNVNGRPLATLQGAPWVYEWDTLGLPSGQNSLNITVRDRAGNQAVKVVPLIVPGAGREREQFIPSGEAVVNRVGADNTPLIAAALGLGLLAAGGVFGVRQVAPRLRRRLPHRCRVHGVTYPAGGACPQCVAQAREQISERLGQFARPSPPTLER